MCCWTVEVKLVSGWRHRKLGFGLHVAQKLDPCMQDSLCSWPHEVPYNLHILGLFSLCLDSFCANELHHTQHISVFLVQFGALCPKPWHLKHCWIESAVLNSSTLKIMPVFWHTESPRNKCLGLFLVVIFYFNKR